MPFNAKGEWVPESESVSSRVTDLTSSTNPYILQARAAGTAGANRRGLLNSSMAMGASEGAAISAALPIASQEAQQVGQHNLTFQQGGYDMDRQRLVTASGDRNAALSAALEANKAYQAAFGQLADNKDIPASTRDAYISHLLDTRNTGMDMIQQIYGINLDWAGKPGGGITTNGGAPASQPFIEATMPSGLSKDAQKAWLAEQEATRARNAAAYGSGPAVGIAPGAPGSKGSSDMPIFTGIGAAQKVVKLAKKIPTSAIGLLSKIF